MEMKDAKDELTHKSRGLQLTHDPKLSPYPNTSRHEGRDVEGLNGRIVNKPRDAGNQQCQGNFQTYPPDRHVYYASWYGNEC